MAWYRFPQPDGTSIVAHIKFARKKGNPVACQAPYRSGRCGVMSAFQCDWKMGEGRTCDRHLCAEHAQEVAPDKHLCPEHQEAYRQWAAERQQQSKAARA